MAAAAGFGPVCFIAVPVNEIFLIGFVGETLFAGEEPVLETSIVIWNTWPTVTVGGADRKFTRFDGDSMMAFVVVTEGAEITSAEFASLPEPSIKKPTVPGPVVLYTQVNETVEPEVMGASAGMGPETLLMELASPTGMISGVTLFIVAPPVFFILATTTIGCPIETGVKSAL
jgi:hypothetical protein